MTNKYFFQENKDNKPKSHQHPTQNSHKKSPLAEIITILLDELKIKYLKKGKKYAVENIKYKIKK